LGQNKVSKVVNHTEHSLFLTSILIGSDFWNTLSADEQAIISEAAIEAARYERSISIDDIIATQTRCEQDGIQIIRMSSEEQVRFADATKGVYVKYADYFSKGLVEQIQQK
jgi:TRAP-type C4-dicarboxylate transport system substrate-binding protein